MIDPISDLRAALREAFYRDAGGEHPLDDITPVVIGLCELVSRWEEGDIEMDQLYPTFSRNQPRGFSITDWFIEMHIRHAEAGGPRAGAGALGHADPTHAPEDAARPRGDQHP